MNKLLVIFVFGCFSLDVAASSYKPFKVSGRLSNDQKDMMYKNMHDNVLEELKQKAKVKIYHDNLLGELKTTDLKLKHITPLFIAQQREKEKDQELLKRKIKFGNQCYIILSKSDFLKEGFSLYKDQLFLKSQKKSKYQLNALMMAHQAIVTDPKYAAEEYDALRIYGIRDFTDLSHSIEKIFETDIDTLSEEYFISIFEGLQKYDHQDPRFQFALKYNNDLNLGHEGFYQNLLKIYQIQKKEYESQEREEELLFRSKYNACVLDLKNIFENSSDSR